MFENLQNV